MSDPSDGGDSEYNIITCVQCSAEVGKVYVRTSQETAKLQDLISLSTDAVCSYQLGRHEMRVQGTGDLNPLSEERVTRLEEQMVKVENVLVLFNERWHAMESALRQQPFRDQFDNLAGLVSLTTDSNFGLTFEIFAYNLVGNLCDNLPDDVTAEAVESAVGSLRRSFPLS